MAKARTTVTEDRFTLAELEKEAVRMMLEDATYQQIAEHQGCSVSTAWARVHRPLAEVTLAPATELKRLMDARLETLLETLWLTALKPGVDQIRAHRECRKTLESLSKLHGLDAPTRRSIEVFEHDAFSVMVGRLEAELAQNDPAPA